MRGMAQDYIPEPAAQHVLVDVGRTVTDKAGKPGDIGH